MAQSTESNHIDPSQITYQNKIGEGGQGFVFKALWRKPDGTQLQVAVKHITDLDKKDEIKYLSQLRHDNILPCYGSYQEMTSLCMVTELADHGDLRTRLSQEFYLPKSLSEKWIKEAAYGLQYLHERGLVHCDVKTPNYLIMSGDKLKLADFGLAKELDKTLSTLAKGTHRWMAPEVFNDLKRSTRSDVYSYGMVVWSISTTEYPFATFSSDYEIMNAVKNGDRPAVPQHCPESYRLLIESCWQANYKSRPSMDSVVQYLHTGDKHLLKPPQDIDTPMNTSHSTQMVQKLETDHAEGSPTENVADFFSKRAEKRKQRRKQKDASS